MSQSQKLIDLTPVSKIVVPVLTAQQKEITRLRKKCIQNATEIKQAAKSLLKALPESIDTLSPMAERYARKTADIAEMLAENNRHFERISELKSPKEMEE